MSDPAAGKAWKIYADGDRRVWWDSHLRLWTLQVVDSAGDQVGSVDYTNLRRVAMIWLKTGAWK